VDVNQESQQRHIRIVHGCIADLGAAPFAILAELAFESPASRAGFA
jgi:hypothetical protein